MMIRVSEKSKWSAPEIDEILDIDVVLGVAVALSEERFTSKREQIRGIKLSTALSRRVSGRTLPPDRGFAQNTSDCCYLAQQAADHWLVWMWYTIWFFIQSLWLFFCLPHCKWHHWACYPMDMWNYSCTSQEWSIETEVQCLEFFAE